MQILSPPILGRSDRLKVIRWPGFWVWMSCSRVATLTGRSSSCVCGGIYLNNPIEQDHRGVKLRIGPKLGFKWFSTAAIVIAGIELVRRIHKGQFNLGRSRLNDRSTPAVWNAVLAA